MSEKWKLTRGEGAAIGIVLSQHLQQRVRKSAKSGLPLGHLTTQEANVMLDALRMYEDRIGELLSGPSRFTVSETERDANELPDEEAEAA